MNWEELKLRARTLTEGEANEGLVRLASDPGGLAVLWLLQRHQAEARAVAFDPRAAVDPGKQAHACGSGYALELLEQEMQARMGKRMKGKEG